MERQFVVTRSRRAAKCARSARLGLGAYAKSSDTRWIGDGLRVISGVHGATEKSL
jgi:hypothetical protein